LNVDRTEFGIDSIDAVRRRRRRGYKNESGQSIEIDVAVAHLVESDESIRGGRDKYDSETVQQRCNTRLSGFSIARE